MHPTTLQHLVDQHTAELRAEATEQRLIRQLRSGPAGNRRAKQRRLHFLTSRLGARIAAEPTDVDRGVSASPW